MQMQLVEPATYIRTTVFQGILISLRRDLPKKRYTEGVARRASGELEGTDLNYTYSTLLQKRELEG